MDNDERAAVAFAAVKAFRDVCGGSPLHNAKGKFCKDGMAEAIGDLIGDLCHLAKEARLDPLALVAQGVRHYAVEIIDRDGMFCESDASIDVSIRPYGSGNGGAPWQSLDKDSVRYLRAEAKKAMAD